MTAALRQLDGLTPLLTPVLHKALPSLILVAAPSLRKLELLSLLLVAMALVVHLQHTTARLSRGLPCM